jgi:hypothetical protein
MRSRRRKLPPTVPEFSSYTRPGRGFDSAFVQVQDRPVPPTASFDKLMAAVEQLEDLQQPPPRRCCGGA